MSRKIGGGERSRRGLYGRRRFTKRLGRGEKCERKLEGETVRECTIAKDVQAREKKKTAR